MGAPPNPVDGTKYAELLLGVPMVLEYDDSTGGFKLVIDVENTLEVTMTGVTIDVGTLAAITNWRLPAQYPEDSMFVGGMTGTFVLAVRNDQMGSYASDDGDFSTLNTDIFGRLYTWTTGSYTFADTEMSAAVALGDALANPTAGGVGAYALGYDSVETAWRRLRVDSETFALLVSVTGSVDTELPAAASLADGQANPTAPSVGSHLMVWDEGNTLWDRVRSTIAPELDAIAEGTVSPTLAASTFGMGFDPVAGDWNRIRVDAVTGAQIVGVTGTVDTELPAALALADAMANPTAPAVGSHLIAYNGVTWDRVYTGLSGSLAVDLISQLDAVNDEVTAYITGSTSLNLMGKTIVRTVIDFSGSVAGETALVAAIGGQQIKVLEVMLIGNVDVSIFFQSGFTGTALTGPLSMPADGDGFFVETPAQMDAHHFETLSGEALVLDVDANVLVGGWLNYYAE